MQVFIANNEVMFINAQLRKSLFGEIFLYPASESAFYKETVALEFRKKAEENWIPNNS